MLLFSTMAEATLIFHDLFDKIVVLKFFVKLFWISASQPVLIGTILAYFVGYTNIKFLTSSLANGMTKIRVEKRKEKWAIQKKRRMCAKIAKYLLLVKKLKIAANNFFIGIFLYSIFHWKSIVWWSVLGWIDKFYITFCNKKKKKKTTIKSFS